MSRPLGQRGQTYKKVALYVAEYVGKYHALPTLGEIAFECDLTSRGSAWRHLHSMEARGTLVKMPEGRVAIELEREDWWTP